jgi:hypothetical protein
LAELSAGASGHRGLLSTFVSEASAGISDGLPSWKATAELRGRSISSGRS